MLHDVGSRAAFLLLCPGPSDVNRNSKLLTLESELMIVLPLLNTAGDLIYLILAFVRRM